MLAQIITTAWPLATTAPGRQILEKALEVADKSQQAALAQHFSGHVLEAASSPHASHVLQKCISSMPSDDLRFLLAELSGHGEEVAKNRYGCRVLQRIIEHFPSEETEELIREVLYSKDCKKLCTHCFANFVIQQILERGTSLQRQRVVAVLAEDAPRLARHRVASHVVKSALINSVDADKQLLVCALSADAEALSVTAKHHCGSFVVREMRRAGG
jgi:mRNA-binding protein PUF3